MDEHLWRLACLIERESTRNNRTFLAVLESYETIQAKEYACHPDQSIHYHRAPRRSFGLMPDDEFLAGEDVRFDLLMSYSPYQLRTSRRQWFIEPWQNRIAIVNRSHE